MSGILYPFEMVRNPETPAQLQCKIPDLVSRHLTKLIIAIISDFLLGDKWNGHGVGSERFLCRGTHLLVGWHIAIVSLLGRIRLRLTNGAVVWIHGWRGIEGVRNFAVSCSRDSLRGWKVELASVVLHPWLLTTYCLSTVGSRQPIVLGWSTLLVILFSSLSFVSFHSPENFKQQPHWKGALLLSTFRRTWAVDQSTISFLVTSRVSMNYTMHRCGSMENPKEPGRPSRTPCFDGY